MVTSTLSCFLTALVIGFRYAVEYLYCFPSAIFYKIKNTKRCPPITDPILKQSAIQLAHKIRTQELTSEEVVSAFINRAKEVNKTLNAIIEERFSDALLEAKKADDKIRSKKYSLEELEAKYPLLGIPVTVKASIAVEDMLFTSCRRYYDPENRKAKNDAEIVKLVKDAGGIITLISSTPELCVNFECYNKVIGLTVNPHDTRRTTGASSGGEAALISSGASIVGLGSDLGGSIRLPASNCGIFGHKPSPRSVSVDGHYPDSKDKDAWEKCFILGPMTRYAEDLTLMMRVISKPNIREELKLQQTVDLKQIKIYYMFEDAESHLIHKMDDDIMNSMMNVVNRFKKDGYNLEKIKIDEFKQASHYAFMPLLLINEVDDIFDKDPDKSAFKELCKCLTFRSNFTLPSILYVILRKLVLNFYTKTQQETLQKKIDALSCKLKGILQNALLLYPTSVRPATYHNQIYASTFDPSYTAIFNTLGFPVTNCPIDVNAEGLPIGLQVVGNVNCDWMTIAMAKEIEKAFGGWKIPKSK